jgi:hypothetical protein
MQSMNRLRFTLRHLLAFTLVAAVLIALVCWWLKNPLRESDTDIAARVFAKTPFGATPEIVRLLAEQQGWQPRRVSDSDQRSGHDLRGHLGSYQDCLRSTHVYVTWRFHEGGLGWVEIERSPDPP